MLKLLLLLFNGAASNHLIFEEKLFSIGIIGIGVVKALG